MCHVGVVPPSKKKRVRELGCGPNFHGNTYPRYQNSGSSEPQNQVPQTFLCKKKKENGDISKIDENILKK